MIETKTNIQNIKLVDFPEEIDEQNGIKLYGEISWENQLAVLSHYLHNNGNIEDNDYIIKEQSRTIDEMAIITKQLETRPTLVPTGIKCRLPKDCYLELSVRSSTPLKTGLVMANGIGVIDCDYYSNPDNDGEIFFQLINLSPFSIMLKKGNIIGQGIIKHYYKVDNDAADGERVGGFGSTSNE